jgi:hypothetical protein
MPLRKSYTPWLTVGQQADLGMQRANHPRQEVRDRCHAILLLAEGQSPEWVAERGLSQPYSLDELAAWVECFNSKGVEGLTAG